MNSIVKTTSTPVVRITNKTEENMVFNAIYDRIDTVIPYDVNWNNGTGYFDKAVDVKLEPGQRAKSFTAGENNRKLIFIGTIFGAVVLFERYTDGNNGVIVSNTSGEVRQLNLVPSGRLGADQITEIMGAFVHADATDFFEYGNVNNRISQMVDLFSGEYNRRKTTCLFANKK